MRVWLFVAGIDGAIAVVMAAVGAHGAALDARQAQLYATANQIQIWHAVALLGVAALADRVPERGPATILLHAVGALFAAGTLLFAGTFYHQVLAGVVPLPYAAPTGGIALVGGWAALAAAALVPRDESQEP